MAQYADLTPQQKQLIAQAERWCRGAMASLVAFADIADFNLKEQFWRNEVEPLISALDPGEVIPNSSGLAGAQDITKEQLGGAMSWLFGLQDNIDSNLALVVKLIGINAGD